MKIIEYSSKYAERICVATYSFPSGYSLLAYLLTSEAQL